MYVCKSVLRTHSIAKSKIHIPHVQCLRCNAYMQKVPLDNHNECREYKPFKHLFGSCVYPVDSYSLNLKDVFSKFHKLPNFVSTIILCLFMCWCVLAHCPLV